MAGSTTGKIRTAVRGLGEIALRVTEEVIGWRYGYWLTPVLPTL